MADVGVRDLDGRVADLVARGDTNAAAEVTLRALGGEILGFLYRSTGDPDTGDDVFSLFSEDLWKGIAGFEGRASLRRWAYRLAWNAACRYWGQAWNRRRDRLDTAGFEGIVAEVRSRTASHQRTEAKLWLAEVREQLKPEDRALVILRLDRGLPLEEVAEVLGMRHDAIRQRWRRLKQKLAKLATERAPDSGFDT